MKNRILKYITVLPLIVLFLGCTESINYKFQDKEQYIKCNSEDDKLLNEALHSFELDIATYYQSKYSDIRTLDIEFAYAYFIFPAAQGNIDLKEIVSEHSIYILNLLKERDYLNNPQSDKTNFNYHKKEVTCLVDHFKNKDLKTSIKSQIDNDFLDPKLMADTYRINIRDAHSNKYFALFLAFETYYQYLVDIDLTK